MNFQNLEKEIMSLFTLKLLVSFYTHITLTFSQLRILKCKHGIGIMTKFLSKYLPRNTLSELYTITMYVRPHLDYDVIYHIPPKKCEFIENTTK